MKTITGNIVRKSLAHFGVAVKTHAEACAAVPFNIISEPAARFSTKEAIPNTQNLYRSDNGYCLGQHTPQFGYLQPCDSLATLEKARQLIGGNWQSVAINKAGRSLTAFVDIEAKITAPKRGDKVGLSIAYFDRYDGQGFARLQLFANVLACNNGMTKNESLVSFSQKHSGDLKSRFAALEFKLLVKLQDQINEMQGLVNALDNQPMTRAEVVSFAEQLFPTDDTDDVATRTKNMREAVITGFARGLGNVGQTRWDAFNSVTEYVDYFSTFRETDFSREENRFESLTTGSGSRIKARALEMLLN